jgi:uroporphyrinogen III methyltransferase/synthase
MQMTTMPLSGKRIIVTRSADQAVILSRKLQNLGATTIEIPTIEITPPSNTDSLDNSIRNLGKYDWIIFTSAHGVESFLQRMAVLETPASSLSCVRIAAIGPTTSTAIQKTGRSPDYVPSKFLSENIATGLDGLRGKRVLLPRADIASRKLPMLLRDKGASVDEVVAYRTVVPRELNGGRLRMVLESGVDLVIFTSPSTVRNFADALLHVTVTKDLRDTQIACIGPVTAEAARQLGMDVDIVANPHTIDGLVEAIVNDRKL